MIPGPVEPERLVGTSKVRHSIARCFSFMEKTVLDNMANEPPFEAVQLALPRLGNGKTWPRCSQIGNQPLSPNSPPRFQRQRKVDFVNPKVIDCCSIDMVLSVRDG